MIICDPVEVVWHVAPQAPDYSQKRSGIWKRRIADPSATVRPMIPEFVDPDCYEIEHSAPEIVARIPDGLTPQYLVPVVPEQPKRVPIPGTLALMLAGIVFIKTRRNGHV